MKDRDFNLAQRKWDNATPTEPLILCLGCGKPVLWNDSTDNLCPECAVKSERISVENVVCPFCGEGDFDLIGLKMHLTLGWCDKYNAVMLDGDFSETQPACAENETDANSPNGREG